MFLGKVIGTVWSTVKWPQAEGLKLLLVRPYHLADLLRASPTEAPTEPQAAARPAGPASAASASRSAKDTQAAAHVAAEAVVCVDLLDAGVGDDVVVAFGHAARVAAADPGSQVANKPIDAAVVAIVDSVALTRPST